MGKNQNQLGISEKDFPRNHATLEDLTQPEIEENLLEAAQTVQEPPQPTKKYKASAKLEDYAEKVNRGGRGIRTVLGASIGSGGGIALTSALGLSEPVVVGSAGAGAIAGSLIANGDYFASKALEKGSDKLETDIDQATKDSGLSTRSINYKLGDEGPYAIKIFGSEGEGDYVEVIDQEELETFLDDLLHNADNSWRIKGKEDHPLLSTGIDSEFRNFRDSYDSRKRIAQEIAESDDGPYGEATVEEVLDVGGDPENPGPVPLEDPEMETNYQFAIVSLDPDYSFDAEDDWFDYSDVLSLEDEYSSHSEEYETSNSEDEMLRETE